VVQFSGGRSLSPELYRAKKFEGEELRSMIEVYKLAIHEALGHGLHQKRSETLPHSITYKGFQKYNLSSLAHTEGIACDREYSSISYLSQHAREMHLSEKEIDLVHKFYELGLGLQVVASYKSLLDGGLLQNVGDGVSDKLSDICKGYEECTGKKMPYLPAYDAMRELAYFIGYKSISEIKSQFKDTNTIEIDQALTTGVWSIDVLPKAVNYFLNDMNGETPN